jgi:hypothetical protein
VRLNVLPEIKARSVKHFASNRFLPINVNVIKESQFVSGHFGLMPLDYMDGPEIFTIVRDPVERFVSYFNYTIKPHQSQKKIEERFYNWLYGEDSVNQSNLQSKFLTGKTNIKKFNKDIVTFETTIESGWHIEDYSLDIKDVVNNLQNMHYYSFDRLDLFRRDMNKSLEKQFGFSTFQSTEKINGLTPERVRIEPSKKDLNRIKELNSVDMELYEHVRRYGGN